MWTLMCILMAFYAYNKEYHYGHFWDTYVDTDGTLIWTIMGHLCRHVYGHLRGHLWDTYLDTRRTLIWTLCTRILYIQNMF